MKPRQFLLAAALLGVALLSTSASYTFASVGQKPVEVKGNAPQVQAHGLPARLKIPRIKVDTSIAHVGLTSAGNMEVPATIADTGWYKYGARPGNKGSAVIAGHLNGPSGEPGVFTNLQQLQPGDSVAIVDEEGVSTTFVVRETRIYDQSARPKEVFESAGTNLNLITCTGGWDTAEGQFSKRLVVFTEKSH